MDRCICPASCQSRQTLEKNVLTPELGSGRKDKKSGILISADEVTVIATVEDKDKDLDPSFQSPRSTSSVMANPSEASISFVTSDQLKQILDQWVEQFARFEALLSRGNMFSMPKTSVKPMPPHTVVSDSPFISPSARLTGPVDAPAEVELKEKSHKDDKPKKDDNKDNKKEHKSRKDKDKEIKQSRKRDRCVSPVQS